MRKNNLCCLPGKLLNLSQKNKETTITRNKIKGNGKKWKAATHEQQNKAGK